MNDNNFNGNFDVNVETDDIFSMLTRDGAGAADSELVESAQVLYQTMGLQMEYAESLDKKKDNRKLATAQFVEIDPRQSYEITQKLVEIYGADSIQVRKWTEQLQKIEYYKAAQQKAIAKRRRQIVVMSILCFLGVFIIGGIVLFVMNSTSYYVNQGDYNYIYRKTLFGAPEMFKDVSAVDVVKEGSDLYYISKEDRKLYCLSVQTKEIESISENSMSEFKIVGNAIYYIERTDNTLYRMNMDGSSEQQIYDEEVDNLRSGNGGLSFTELKSGIVKRLDTRTLAVS